ncbi:hypothetical protein [Salinisphaera sp. G21_0]|uniref:hypothetical protein n=1 Tax=Salinisphaera sp. G21_0 TaxID=2821094 RepID=UPI001ADD3258|nr:hypothetical protein [Salinisphaera sp. G21_0]MBO9483576.1 hypothetical protein [Salinisphaera sp. G21_0]
MISNNSTFQPQFTNERIKQEEIIEREKDTRNIADDHVSPENHNTKKIFENDIFVTSVINQLNKPENTLEKLSPDNLSEPEHCSAPTNKGMKWHDRKKTAYESSACWGVSAKAKNRKKSSIIESSTLQQVDCLIPKDKQWISFLENFFKKAPIQASSMNRITSLQTKAGKVEEIVFLVENRSYNHGYGNLNLYIEFLRNFVRLSPGTLRQIRFSGCEHTLSTKLPNLISGLPDRDIDDSIIHGSHRSSSPKTRPNEIFGIPFIVQRRIPTDFLSKNTLQIYTVWDAFRTTPKAPLFQITNYRWFPRCVEVDLLQNEENHLPVYPYEVSKNTSTPELMKKEIANILQTMNPATLGTDNDTETLAQFFTDLFQSAKEKKIYLALSYHYAGMSKYTYYNYTNTAKACFSDKPIIIIAPHNEKKYLSEKKQKELSDTGKIQFSTNYSLNFTTEKSIKDNVTVFEFGFLPKRLFELVCYFSNIPIYAPGASTANIAQCLNKPYLGLSGHEIPETGNPELLSRWYLANVALYFDSFRMQEVKSALLTMSKEQIKLSSRKNFDSWHKPENAHLELEKIYQTITSHILTDHGLIATLMPHFFNGTDTSKIYKCTIISADDRQSYFTRLLDEGRLPEFCQFVCDTFNEILLDYMSRTTTPGDDFYELARELQQKALHPDNNMMLEVLERHLPNN